jgi:membrane protein involved in colicin uptake
MLVERGYSKPQSLRRDKLASGSHLSAWGGRMRNYLIVMVATMCLGISLASAVRAQDVDWRSLQQQLKSQQKHERDALKARQQNLKQSWKNAEISSAARAQAMHQMERERRDLKQKQKDAMQDLKDRKMAFKENQRVFGQ